MADHTSATCLSVRQPFGGGRVFTWKPAFRANAVENSLDGTPIRGVLWPLLRAGHGSTSGSYDFIFALPLFVVAIGLLRDWVITGLTSARSALALGLLLGSITALSAAVGVSLILLLGGWILLFHRRGGAPLGSIVFRLLVAVGVAAIFVARSVAGVVEWFGYPGHVITDTGSPPYHAIITGSVYGGWMQLLDPFVPFKWRVSPIPVLSVELQILLVVGVVLSGWLLVRPQSALSRLLSPELVRWVIASTIILLAETSILLALGTVNGSVSGIQSVTNVWETSILLFLFYQLIAVLPLIAATNYLGNRPSTPRKSVALARPPSSCKPISGGRTAANWRPIAVAVLLVALGTGERPRWELFRATCTPISLRRRIRPRTTWSRLNGPRPTFRPVPGCSLHRNPPPSSSPSTLC